MDYQTIYIQVYCSLLQAFYNNPQQSESNKSQQFPPNLLSQKVNTNKKNLAEVDENLTELADFYTKQILEHIQNK